MTTTRETTTTRTIQSYEYNPDEVTWDRDFHSVVTITLGELVHDGWIDWSDASWHWDAYDDDQYNRLNAKIEARYWDREIGILPPGAWKRRFIGRMNEIMPKYKLLYDKVKDGLDIWQDSDEYHKERTVGSEYPQTMLQGTQDYASDGQDNEYETIRDGSMLDKIQQYQRYYVDIDVMILDDIDVLFSSLYTVSINGF